MLLIELQNLIFYLIIFLIPANLAKHWPQNWSFVNGILIDYLIPTLYLTDILIIGLLILWLKTRPKFKIKNWKKKGLFFSIFLLFIYSQLRATNPAAAFYKLVKLSEFFFLIIYIKNNINIKKDIKKISQALSYSVVWQSVLAISQWFNQGSIFGYWFFGEQPYHSATLGIKLINFFGQLKIPSYGTFPHANVLAGFLVISLIMIFHSLDYHRFNINDIKSLALVLGIIALFLTFSLPAWITLAFIFSYLLFKKTKKRKWLFKAGFLLFFFLLGLLVNSFLDPSSFQRRLNLNQIAIKIWLSSPFLGVGLNNFVVRMEEFGQVVANIRFLQPVHNLALLILSETGIIGGLVIGYWLLTIKTKLGKKRKEKNIQLLICSFIGLLFLGLFDHYFLTIQQGLLISSLILGLIISL